jgi:hypothetical protein
MTRFTPISAYKLARRADYIAYDFRKEGRSDLGFMENGLELRGLIERRTYGEFDPVSLNIVTGMVQLRLKDPIQ